MPPISTKQTTQAAAVRVAWDWYTNGIPKKTGRISLDQCKLVDIAKKSNLTQADAVNIIKELQKKGLIKSAVVAGSPQAVDLAAFLLSFWDYDASPYVKEKLRKNHGIHRRYCSRQYGAVKNYWIPFFAGRLLGDLSRQDIDRFIEQFEGEYPQGVKCPKSAKGKNAIIKAGTIPLEWAFKKEIIEKNITSGITWFSGSSAERQLLSPEMAQAIFSIAWDDDRAKLANMLAMSTGMRAGEIQGLRVQDIGSDCLYVRHSWNLADGLKTTKNNENRVVEMPFPAIMRGLFDLAQSNPHGQGLDGYIFYASIPGKPAEAQLFLKGLRGALCAIGIDKEAANAYTVHGWRHYFTAYMKDRVNEKILQRQTGHKTVEMLTYYASHRISGDRETMQNAQVQTFGAIIPNTAEFNFNMKKIHGYIRGKENV